MADEGQFIPSNSGDGGGAVVMISSTTMVAAIIFLFLVVVFVFFLYLYVRRYLGPNRRPGSHGHFIFAEGIIPGPGRGLDLAVLQSLPVTVYRADDFVEGLECAVCLSVVVDGEEARLLPKCNHGFHLECIDMWFHSHATCPLCRTPVGPQNSDAPVSLESDVLAQAPPTEAVPEVPAFPTDVLFSVTAESPTTVREAAEGEGPSSTSSVPVTRLPGGALVIEIPSRVVDAHPSPISPLPPSRLPTEEMKSPVSSRIKSLTRLLSGGKRPASSSYSPMGGDIEHGLRAEGSALTPKTPAS